MNQPAGLNHIHDEINSITKQIISLYSPSKIIIFGSQVKGTATIKSDIDICIVKATDYKRALLTEMYLKINTNKPYDLLLYTETEWNHCIKDSTSFAYQINKKGIVLYDR